MTSTNEGKWVQYPQMTQPVYMQPMPFKRRFEYPLLPEPGVGKKQEPAINIQDTCSDRHLTFGIIPSFLSSLAKIEVSDGQSTEQAPSIQGIREEGFRKVSPQRKATIMAKKQRRQQRRNRYEYQSYDNQIFV